MKRFFKSIAHLMLGILDQLLDDIATGINDRSIIAILINSLLLVAYIVALVLSGVLLLGLAVKFADWLALIGIAFALLYRFATSENAPTSMSNSSVDAALAEQRAEENYDSVRSLICQSIVATSQTTKITRPLDEFAVETASLGAHFYMAANIPVYQFEAILDAPIDKAEEDIILRELQRNTIKLVARYPMLCSDEARGRAPVEILDVKNLGGRIVIEVVLTNAASLPMIEARRRARIERKQRQTQYSDEDYR